MGWFISRCFACVASVLFVLSLIVVASPGPSPSPSPSPSPGPTSREASSVGTQRSTLVCNFNITWTEPTSANDGDFSIRIVNINDPTRTLFKSIPFTPFVAVGYGISNKSPIVDGNLKVDEWILFETPYLKIVSSETKTLQSSQTVDSNSVGCHLQSLIIRGEVWGGATRASFSITFGTPFKDSSHNQPADANRDMLSNQLAFEVVFEPIIGEFNRAFLKYWCDEREQFFGFGSQFSQLNLKGTRIPILVAEQGIGRGDQPTTAFLNWFMDGTGGRWHTSYAPKPVYVTNFNRSMLFTNSELMFFDLRAPNAVVVEAWSSHLSGRIFYGQSLSGLVTEITLVTGRMAPLPDWTQSGAIVALEGGTDNVRHIMSQLREAKYELPICAVWLQDWSGLRHSYDGDRLMWNWVLNQSYYPEWNNMVTDWEASNIRVLTYINPFFSDPKELAADELTHSQSRNLYQEGIDNGFFVKKRLASGRYIPYPLHSGSIAFHMVDLSNPAACRWMKDIIKSEMIVNTKAKGWMADFGEYLPFDAVLHDTAETGASYHNRYPEEWSKLNAQAVQEAFEEGLIAKLADDSERSYNKGDYNNCVGTNDSKLPRPASNMLFFVRSAWLRSSSYANLFWLGDQLVNWGLSDGIKSSIVGALSGGLSGHTLTHSDIGGYTMQDTGPFPIVRSRELLYRWIELSAFSSAVFRTHVGSSIAPLHAQVYTDDDSITFFSRFTHIFKQLKYYRLQLMDEASQLGWPLIRPMFFHYPNDDVWAMTQQYMFGHAFLIAPVLEPAENSTNPLVSWLSGSLKSNYGDGSCPRNSSVTVNAYLPKNSIWLHLWSGTVINGGVNIAISAPIGYPPVFYLQSNSFGEDLRAFIVSKGWNRTLEYWLLGN